MKGRIGELNKEACMSYKDIHRGIAILAYLLPLVLFIQNGLKQSISICYYTQSRDWFEITLGGCGVFFLFVSGYDWKEKLLMRICGLCMLLIGLCGCLSKFSLVHDICAIVLFSTLGFISFWSFTRIKGHRTLEKIKRNKIYEICGLLIWIFLISVVVFSILGKSIMISESLLFWSFATAWSIQGQFYSSLKDK